MTRMGLPDPMAGEAGTIEGPPSLKWLTTQINAEVPAVQFGIFTIGDLTPDPTTGRTPTEHERITAMTRIALAAEGRQRRITIDWLTGRARNDAP